MISYLLLLFIIFAEVRIGLRLSLLRELFHFVIEVNDTKG